MKESALHARSEHGYAGGPGGVPPADFTKGKARQTHLAADQFLKVRSVGAYGYADQSVYDAMAAWVENYDITTVAWDTMAFGGWNVESRNVSPDVFFPNYTPGDQSYYQLSPSSQYFKWADASSFPLFYKCQIGITPALGSFEGYMIIAVDVSTMTAVYGCTYTVSSAAPPFVVNLPVPSGAYNPVPYSVEGIYYFFGLIGPQGTIACPTDYGGYYYINVAPDLTAFAQNFVQYPLFWNGFSVLPPTPLVTGPDWNAGLACLVPSGPPFA